MATIKTVVEALDDYHRARKEHDEAEADADPYSWGYSGTGLRATLADAERGVQIAIDAAIDARLIACGLLVDRRNDI